MNEYVNDEETVSVSAVDEAVLDLLDQDIIAHTERLQPITAEQVRRVQSLIGDVSVELETPLPPDDA
ncbi:MAG: transcriptional regulator [Gammaproteobacteria bacterium HGW-Gammaproteobacteria-6]|jgi:hypothetical protein|nr:MAG: transcriptional regulator [Gammaproteobacteria bacterium HGW-Gammaproteobacteria-6]